MSERGRSSLADTVICGILSVLLLLIGDWFQVPTGVAAESAVLWVAGVLIGLAGVYAGWWATLQASGMMAGAAGVLALTVSFGGALGSAWSLVS